MYDVHLKHFVVFHVTMLGKGYGCMYLEGGLKGGFQQEDGAVELPVAGFKFLEYNSEFFLHLCKYLRNMKTTIITNGTEFYHLESQEDS